jgi:hypothetical protein
MTTKTLHLRTFTKALPESEGYGNGRKITATAVLHQHQGNSAPHFSITADIYHPRARDIDAGGCLHDEIARHFPALIKFLPLHLSDNTGRPMHAAANAKYWADQSDVVRLREHLRTYTLRARGWIQQYQSLTDAEAKASYWEHVCTLEAPRWQAEADEFISFLKQEEQAQAIA